MFTINHKITGEILSTYDTFEDAVADFIDIIMTDPDLYNEYWEEIEKRDFDTAWATFADYHNYDIPNFYAIYEI